MYKILATPYSKIFFHEWKLNPYTSDYNIVFHQDLEGEVDVRNLQNALSRFVKENVLINSHLLFVHDKLFWVKNKELPVLVFFDSSLSSSEIIDLIEKPFNLLEGPLYRFYLIKTKLNHYKLVIVLHHLIIDGSTISYFNNEISNYYNNKKYKNSITIKEQIKKILTLSEYLNKLYYTHKEESKKFWEHKLANIEPIDTNFLISSALKDQSALSFLKIQELRFSFPKEILDKILKLKHILISPYFYGRAVFAFLLNRYTEKQQICINYPISITEGKEFIYGGQVNTTFICYDFALVSNFIDVLEQSKIFINTLRSENINHAYLPIFEIPSLVKNLLNCSYSTTTLRDTPFNFDNISATVNNSPFIDLVGDWLFEQGISNGTISCIVRYRTNKINKYFLSNFIESYKELFVSILDDIEDSQFIPIKQLTDYTLLTYSQYKQIIQEWNDTNSEYPNDKTIHQLFEEQVERTPNNIAIVHNNIKLTYKELNDKTNKLANYIKQIANIKPDTLVALFIDRNEHMLISILAVLKAGGAYVPIDPEYPESRIKYILEEINAKLILTNKIYHSKIGMIINNNPLLKNKIPIIVYIDDQVFLDNIVLSGPSTNPRTLTTSYNLAYVLYTSGTTGNPKGVMIEHTSVVNLLYQTDLKGQFNPNESGTLWTNINFDVSVYEIFSILLNGATLHILSQEVRENPVKFFSYIENNKINYSYIPPYFLIDFPQNKIFSLKLILLGVEKIKFTHLKNILESNKDIKILNGYGPTEATVFCTKYLFNTQDAHLKYLPIGVPLSNTLCYVLDKNFNPVPIGVTGELYIGGTGLA